MTQTQQQPIAPGSLEYDEFRTELVYRWFEHTMRDAQLHSNGDITQSQLVNALDRATAEAFHAGASWGLLQ